MRVEASAPSNIAIIKYMGKTDAKENIPTNSSLSWTLDELRSFVRITQVEDLSRDQWQPMHGPDYVPTELNEKSIQRFLNHFQNLKKSWGVEKNFLIESANNFPSDCGLASSASSFAALTMAAVEILQKISPKPEVGQAEMAELARRASGSSCRSFFGPWVLWHNEGVRPLEFPMPNLLHQVVIVDASKKEVSSSEAHLRVATSPLFKTRTQRAERRLADSIHALQNQDWKNLSEIAWAEFMDMHSLFETSNPGFGYMQSSSAEILDAAKAQWSGEGDGPVVTMDAGANVHLLWREDQLPTATSFTLETSKRFKIFSCRKIREALSHG